MLTKTLLLAVFGLVASEITPGGFERTMSKSVKSLGYKTVYGDEDTSMMSVNEVVNDVEKSLQKKRKNNINHASPPLPAEDVKCFMSSDSYCTNEMNDMKRVIFQAMTNGCAKCSDKESDKAGKIVASLIAHNPDAWKMFLTRHNIDEAAKIVRG